PANAMAQQAASNIVLVSATTASQPASVRPLNDADAALYREAFTLIDAGEYEAAQFLSGRITDRSLMGYVEFHKLFHPNYTSTYEELTAWMAAYGDHPMAMRVWSLAKRKKP